MPLSSTSSRRVALAAAALLVVAVVLVLVLGRGGPSDAEAPADAAADTPAAPVAAGGLAAADLNGDGIVYRSGMHPWIVEDEPGTCPICGMDLQPVRVDGAGEAGTVRVDPVTLQNIGVRTARVEVESLQRTVRTTGRFEANERGVTAVSPRVSGWIERLHVNFEGARVGKGQPLLELYSPDLVATQEEYLLALRNRERLAGTPAEADAQRLVDAARRRLAYWDISSAQVERLEATGTPTKTLTLYAPAAGTVVRTNAIEGQQVRAGETLMELSDLSELWLMVDVYEQDLAWVTVGTLASVEVPFAPGQRIAGRIDYLYDAVDPTLRTMKARVRLPNPGLRLKPGMYATVELVGGASEPMPVVPSEAVLRTGERDVVLLALGDGRFAPREVQTGVEAGDRVQILTGLLGGEEIVTSAQFLIDSEARLGGAIRAMSGADPAPGHAHDATHGAPPSTPQLRDGVQEIAVTVTSEGFSPARLQLRAGVPARITFTRRTETTCATEVHMPGLGVAATPLPLDTPVTIAVTPREGGTFTFACAMDMIEGTVLVRS